jgi:putative ABC transport system permease protein
MPEPNTREVLVSEAFANVHGLRPGDGVEAILNGRLERLAVSGVALSPEFIYLIGPGSVFPDDERFGVFWMGREAMAAAFDMEGAWNDLVIRVTPGANVEEIIDRIDALTERYAGLGAYGRDEQTSHEFLANEIEELRGSTLIIPTIFLGVAAFLLNLVLSRMIAVQREQIAALKALGYSRWEIGRHYLGFVLLITLFAVVAGSGLGAWMGRGLTGMYAEFFRFPHFDYTLRLAVLLLGLLVSAAAAIIGVAHALRSAMRLPPAEAMRPQPPASFRPTVIERLGVHRLVPAAVRMILRQLERRPIKTLLSCLGIALATAILVVGAYTEDAVEYIIDFQFSQVQRYDLDVVFADRTDDAALSTVRHMPGVLVSEPYRGLAVRLRHGHRERRVGIMGLCRADGLHRLLDMNGGPVRLPPEGIVLSSTLAKNLGVRIGEDVTVEVLEGRRPVRSVPVTGTIDDFAGLSAYMDLTAMNRMMQEQGSAGGAFLAADPTVIDRLYSDLREAPQVAAVNVKSAVVASFRRTIAESIVMMRTFIITFAVIIAFGVVYNSARISLSERARDLATLRVIGFSRAEVSVIQLGELAILTGLAVPAGLVLGYGLSWATSAATESELFRMPFVIAPSTFGFAAIVVVIASTISGLIVRRRLDRLDLVAVLKSRE